jgi:hypothetical protein
MDLGRGLPSTYRTGARLLLTTIGEREEQEPMFIHTLVTASDVSPTIAPCPIMLQTQHLGWSVGRCRRNNSDGVFVENKTLVIVPEVVKKVEIG